MVFLWKEACIRKPEVEGACAMSDIFSKTAQIGQANNG